MLNGDMVKFEEGISVDANGVATPIIRNVSPKETKITVSYVDSSEWTRRVYVSDIEVVPVGLQGFVTVDV